MSQIAEAVKAMRHRNHLRLSIRKANLKGLHLVAGAFERQLEQEEAADRDILYRAQLKRNAGNRTAGRW